MNNRTKQRTSLTLTQWHSYFDIGEHTIRVTGSNLTGSEHIYVDEHLVSKKLNWRFKSSHTFTIDEQSYTIVIELLQLLKPKIKVELCKDNAIIDHDFVFGPSQRGNSWLSIGVGLACGFVTGMGMYYIVEWMAR